MVYICSFILLKSASNVLLKSHFINGTGGHVRLQTVKTNYLYGIRKLTL